MADRLDPAVPAVADDPAARLEAAAVPTTLADRHEVTEHWDAYGGEILHRTCTCGRGWANDDVRVCPEAPYADDEDLGVAWSTIAELAGRVERREVDEHEAAEIIAACFRAAELGDAGGTAAGPADAFARRAEVAYGRPATVPPVGGAGDTAPDELSARSEDRRALDDIAEACGAPRGDHRDDVVMVVRSMLQDPAMHNARRARALAVVKRLVGAAQNLIEDNPDPGTEAFGAVWEGREFLRQGGGALAARTATPPPAEPEIRTDWGVLRGAIVEVMPETRARDVAAEHGGVVVRRDIAVTEWEPVTDDEEKADA